MTTPTDDETYLSGKILIATPEMKDPRFERAVIYLCGHDDKGAMGIILNKYISDVNLEDIMEQMELEHTDENFNPNILYGGPVEMGRGFVIHSADVTHDSSVEIDEFAYLNGTTQMLEVCASPERPRNCRFALGYSGWGVGQLEAELQTNSWLVVDADPDLVFSESAEDLWQMAADKLGIDPLLISTISGNA